MPSSVSLPAWLCPTTVFAKHAKINTDPRGFFVHVRVPEDTAARLKAIQQQVLPAHAIPQAIDHVTLVYTPKADAPHSDATIDATLTAMRAQATNTGPLDAKLQGWAYFDNVRKKGKPATALVALVDAPGLDHLHVDLTRAMAQQGIKPMGNHGFTPHITLGYLPPHGRITKPLPPLNASFAIDKVHVATGEHHEVALGVKAAAAAAAAAAAFTDRLPGGKADAKTPADFDPAALARGTAHEREHTREGPVAREIAMDHLAEDPRYYTKLEALEKAADAKLAARAGMKRIRAHVAKGNFDGAEKLINTPGVLKPTPQGSQIRHLGSGMEGTSTLVANPGHGLQTRKVFDSQGISDPRMVAHKAEAGRALQGNPDFARFHGEVPTQAGAAHLSEFVRPAAPGVKHDNDAIVARARGAGAGIGTKLHDIHKGNIVNGKVVDYLPVKPGRPTGLRSDVMERGEAADAAGKHQVNHAFTNYLQDKRRPGNLMAQAFRGAQPLVQQDSPAANPKWASLGAQAAKHAAARRR